MPAATVGLAWSGGGLTGFMASMCATVALRELSPPGEMWNSLNYSLAVNSGGTLGSILMDSVPPGRLRFPPSWDPSSYTYSQMASKFEVGHHRPGSVWFGAVNGLIPSSVPSTDVRGGGANHGWWVDALGVALAAYGLTAPELSAGTRPIGAGVSLLRQAAAPIIRDEASGTMHDALGNLIAAEVDLRSGRLEAVGEPARGGGRPFPAVSNVSVLGGGAMSSAFWGAAIVELPRGLEWDASKAALIALPGEVQAAEGGGTRLAGGSSQAETGWYAMDGGVVDTSGIAALLRRRVKRIVAFENKNSDLRQINATYAFLFGVDTPTDTMNSLQGPALAQVFPAELYPAVIANLTDGSVLHAHLTNVPVRANPYWGIAEPFVLESLLIVSNQRSEAFLQEVSDENIVHRLDARWPNRFEVAMPTLDANMLCVFAGWRVRRLATLLRAVFQ